MKVLAVAFISILFSVAAQFSLKAGMSSADVRQSLTLPFSWRTIAVVFSNWNVLGGFFLYALGAIVWLAVLSRLDVSKAYPLVGLGFILTFVIGTFLGEHASISRIIGVALICAGIIMVGRS